MNDDDLEQAARWHARLEDVPDGASTKAAHIGFEAWYHERDDNRRAFTAVAEVEGIARDLHAEPALQALADEALARAAARSPWRLRWGLAGLAGAMVVVPVAALTLRHFVSTPSVSSAVAAPSRIYTTAIGQRRLVVLDDATRVLLDTDSRLTVDGSRLTLRGQAEVTAGRSPVQLQMDEARVAIRTGSFNVRMDDERADVLAQDAAAEAIATLGEGSSRRDVVVRRGALLSLADDTVSMTIAADPGSITGWQTGWLQFDDVPLPRAVREVNRYRQRPIRLSGNAAPLRISGSFRTGSGDTFLEAVAATLPATVDQSAESPTILVGGPPK